MPGQRALAVDLLPAEQVMGVLVAAVQVGIKALLLKHEDLLPLPQHFVQVRVGNAVEVQPLPFDHWSPREM